MTLDTYTRIDRLHISRIYYNGSHDNTNHIHIVATWQSRGATFAAVLCPWLKKAFRAGIADTGADATKQVLEAAFNEAGMSLSNDCILDANGFQTDIRFTPVNYTGATLVYSFEKTYLLTTWQTNHDATAQMIDIDTGKSVTASVDRPNKYHSLSIPAARKAFKMIEPTFTFIDARLKKARRENVKFIG